MKNGQGAEACFRKALLALDLSEASEKLVAWTPNLHLLGTKTILLLHVIPEHPLRELAHITPLSTLVEHQRSRATRLLSQYAARISSYGFEAEALAPKHGNPAAWIVRAAKLHDVDYIVLGSKGHSLLRSILIGSTAEEVVATSDRPVLLVRLSRGTPPNLRDGPLLAAVDFDLYLDDIIACAATIAARANTELVLLHVIEPGEDPQEAREKLEDIAAKLRRDQGVAVTVKIYEKGKPGKVIVEEAAKIQSPLILIGPGSPTHTSLTGITGEAVVRRAPTNVIVCRRARRRGEC